MRAIQISEVKTLKAIDIPDPGQARCRERLWSEPTAWAFVALTSAAILGKFPFFDFPRIPGPRAWR